ncbi:MAG: HPF/RaiA family ribosome-associated protein [Candidatus Paceibacterota bacterium]|jgi:ribosome-associated translation inhibitor RaiA
MNITITSKNFELLKTYKNNIEVKFNNLEKFTKRFKNKVDLDVTIIKDTKSHETGNIFFAKAKFQIPGKDLFCEEKGSSLDEAVDKLKDSLKRLIIENKEIKQSYWRRIAKIFRK